MLGFWTSVQDSVRFGAPHALMFVPLAAVCFLLWLVVLILQRRHRPARSQGSSYPLIGRIKLWLAAVIIATLTGIAAAEPLLLHGGSTFKRGSVDVVIAIDVSASMWVKDLGPSRLQVAVREVLDLQSQGILREGDRAGVFVFGGTTIRKLHLSTNIERLVDVVGKLAPPDTLTGDAFPWESDAVSTVEHIYQSLDNQDQFERGDDKKRSTVSQRPNRVVVLVTDGDFGVDAEQMRRLDGALTEFRRRGLALYPIGVGTRIGSDLTSVLRDYRPGRDYDASLAEELDGQRTRLNIPGLSFLARRTGGKMFLIESAGRSAADFLREIVEAHRPVSFQLVPNRREQGVWSYLIAIGIAMFALAVLFY